MADGLSIDPSVSDTLMFGSSVSRGNKRVSQSLGAYISLSAYSFFMVAERWFYDDC